MEATVQGRCLRLGRASFALRGEPLTGGFEGCVILADQNGPLAAFRLEERLRPGAKQALDNLAARGLEVEILSGDASERVASVARQLGVKEWRAGQLPEQKLQRLRQLQDAGARVAMVGDGINDAAVLAGADVAIAMAGGTDLAQASSDIVLSGENLLAVDRALELVRGTLAVLRQNQRWALAYNLGTVPLAALGLVPPWLAALGMSASSLMVVLNAMRIGRDAAQP
jgi:Cu2+-exporting ATPase